MKIKSLLLVWRDKVSSLYFHVGRLTYNGKLYTFEYTHHSDAERKLSDAIEHGYHPHPAFKDIKKKYQSERLFPAFDRRIPSSDRVDYEKILNQFNLPLDADRMDILKATRGMVASNPYFFEEPLVLDEEKNTLSNHFYISGMKYRELPDEWAMMLSKGDSLQLVMQSDNDVDSNAIKVLTENGLWLGYIPGIFAKAIGALMERDIPMNVTVDEKRLKYAPQWWVRVSFEAELDHNETVKINELDGLLFNVA